MSDAGSMVTVDVGDLKEHTARIFAAVGCDEVEAAMVAEDLVVSDQMDVQSHGTSRVKEYLVAVGDGRVRPGGRCSIVTESDGTALVDGGTNFGQVVGRFAFDVAAERAKALGVSCVVTRNSFHLGRVGSLGERAASLDLICLATVAVGLPGLVAPWGSAEGILGTNPFGYGVPTDDGMVVADFATSTMAEGAIALARRDGRRLPEGIIVGADGEPTTDPAELFGDPPGAILPIGGPVGYKGYALNLLPELVAAGLAGYGPKDQTRPSNCLFLVLVDPSTFLATEVFKRLAGDSARLVGGARPRPGFEVLLPGEREARAYGKHSTHVRLPSTTVADLRKAAVDLGVEPSF